MPLFMNIIIGVALIWCAVYLVSTAVWEIKNSFKLSGIIRICITAAALAVYAVSVFKYPI